MSLIPVLMSNNGGGPATTDHIELSGGYGLYNDVLINNGPITEIYLTNNFKIEWEAAATLGQSGAKYVFNLGNSDYWCIIWNAVANTFEFYVAMGNYTGVDPRTAFPVTTDTNWHSYEVSYNGTNIVLKVDGVTASTTAKAFTLIPPTVFEAFHVASRPGSPEWYGSIRNIKVTKTGVLGVNYPLAVDGQDIENGYDLTLFGSYIFA